MIRVYKARSYIKKTVTGLYVLGTEPFKNDKNDNMEFFSLGR